MNRRSFLKSCGMAVAGVAGVGKATSPYDFDDDELVAALGDVTVHGDNEPIRYETFWEMARRLEPRSINRIANIEKSPFPDFDEQRVIQICDEIEFRERILRRQRELRSQEKEYEKHMKAIVEFFSLTI